MSSTGSDCIENTQRGGTQDKLPRNDAYHLPLFLCHSIVAKISPKRFRREPQILQVKDFIPKVGTRHRIYWSFVDRALASLKAMVCPHHWRTHTYNQQTNHKPCHE